LKSGIFHGALAAKNWTKKIPIVGSVVDVVTDKVVFSQVKAATGGNLKYAVNGGKVNLVFFFCGSWSIDRMKGDNRCTDFGEYTTVLE